MPTYEYACTGCGTHLEVVRRMADEPLRECSLCGGDLRRVFSPIGIVFKGSGFYRNDSRSGSGKKEPAKATGEKSGDRAGEKSGDKAGEKTGEKPKEPAKAAGGESAGSSAAKPAEKTA